MYPKENFLRQTFSEEAIYVESEHSVTAFPQNVFKSLSPLLIVTSGFKAKRALASALLKSSQLCMMFFNPQSLKMSY